MEKNEITVEVNCPVHKVFAFTVDPVNTPKWIKSITAESRSDEETSVGTIYTNISGDEQRKTSYQVTAYEVDRVFGLRRVGDDYRCTYIYASISEGARTRLTYIEEVGSGTLEEPLDAQVFDALKNRIESHCEDRRSVLADSGVL